MSLLFAKTDNFFFLQVAANQTDSSSINFFLFTVAIRKSVTILIIERRELNGTKKNISCDNILFFS